MVTTAIASWCAPFVSRKAREILTISLSLQTSTRRGSSVTSATTTASRFSSLAKASIASTFFGSTTIAMRSCDSEIASSVPSSPAYFFGTLSSCTRSPSASSPIATETPPAPKSLHFLIKCATSGRRNNLCNFRSVGAFPFCTSAPHTWMDSVVCALDEPVAPPQPSLPVRPPIRIMISPGSEFSRITFLRGAAPITAPISIRFAT